MSQITRIEVPRWLTPDGMEFLTEGNAETHIKRLADMEADRVRRLAQEDGMLRVIYCGMIGNTTRPPELAAICTSHSDALEWMTSHLEPEEGDVLAPDGMSITNEGLGNVWFVQIWRPYTPGQIEVR